MAKKALITVDGNYKKIKKGFITVDGVYKKIKKAYITIGGVYRPCWSGGELAYYGTIADLSRARDRLSATTVGNYALFAGGYGIHNNVISSQSAVDAYDRTLTRTLPTALSFNDMSIAATTVGNYALFGGGTGSDCTKVNAYNETLTRSTPDNFRYDKRRAAATAVGNYALFAGCTYSGYGKYVEVYDGSLTKLAVNSSMNLSTSRYNLAATTVGNYAIFAGGGDDETSLATTDAYDASLTKVSSVANLGSDRESLAATTVGNYALFGGGLGYDYTDPDWEYESATSYVTAYDTSLTRTVPARLRTSVQSLAATTVGNYAIFGGGLDGAGYSGDNSRASNQVTVYDTALTCTYPEKRLGYSRRGLAATTVGNYALFGGGNRKDYASADANYSSLVEVYTIS